MILDGGSRWTLLASLGEADRREVTRAAVRRRFRNGDTLFHEGDPGDSVHLLDRGHVAIRIVSRSGDVVTLDVMEPGDSFGEQALLVPHARRTASVVAIGAVETLMLHRDAFTNLRRNHPTITDVLVDVLASQVRRLSAQLLDAHTLSADERVVKQLARMARSFAVDGSASIPLTQEDLATLAGTTRPTANRALQPLVAAGVITLRRGGVEVPDLARLDPW